MHQIKICFVILFLLFSFYATSAQAWYQVEVIIFDRLRPNLDGEQWQNEVFKMRDDLVELQLADHSESGLIPYILLPKSRNRLNGIYRIFKLTSEYKPLIHLSWQQPATRRSRSRYVHLQKLDQQQSISITNSKNNELEFIESFTQSNRLIDGAIRIRSGFYLHVDIDLFYFKELPSENKIIRTNEASLVGNTDRTVIRLNGSRRIKLNEVHYFDHPVYGVILQVSRL